MSKVSTDKLYDLQMYLGKMRGNSVNLYETDDLIRELSKSIDNLKSNINDPDLLTQVLLTGSEFQIHALELRLSPTANYWAAQTHKEYSKKFSEAFSAFRKSLK